MACHHVACLRRKTGHSTVRADEHDLPAPDRPVLPGCGCRAPQGFC